jgi:tetratricopeptide (TPR) repeat protein
LLILDNADVEDVLFKPVDVVNATSQGTAQKRMIDFLAIPSHGQTVLTTRHNKVASQFVDDCDVITVGPMTKSDAIDLFRKKAGEHHDATDIEELVGELGYIPLAIAHAAAFIKRKVPLCTVQTYLEELRNTVESDASLLTANYNELRRDDEANNSVINTWQVSFEHIRQIRPSAADRLSLMSFYDHRSIPRTLLMIRYTDADLTGQHMSTDSNIDEDLLMLYEFHLISIGVGSEAFELHPLVQLAARKWLQWQNNEDQWLRGSLLNLTYAWLDNANSFPQYMNLLPHSQLALTYALQDEGSALCLAAICFQASHHVECLLGASESSLWARRSWVERTKHLGNTHIETLRAELRLADLLHILGKKEESQNMLNCCSAIAEKHSGSSREWKGFHIECLHVLGKGETSQGNLADAETYFRRALELCNKHSETVHIDIPTCVNSLAGVLLHQKKHSEAEATCRHALVTCIEFYGSKHDCTLRVTESLADVLYDKGDSEAALEMYNGVFEGRKHTSEVEYLVTLSAKAKIAGILQAQQKTQEAVDIWKQVHQLSSDHYGKEMFFTLLFAQIYAHCLFEIGDFDRALEVVKTCATSSQRVLGPDPKSSIERIQLLVASAGLLRERRETQRELEKTYLWLEERLCELGHEQCETEESLHDFREATQELLRNLEEAPIAREEAVPKIKIIVLVLKQGVCVYGAELRRLGEQLRVCDEALSKLREIEESALAPHYLTSRRKCAGQ